MHEVRLQPITMTDQYLALILAELRAMHATLIAQSAPHDTPTPSTLPVTTALAPESSPTRRGPGRPRTAAPRKVAVSA